MPRAALAGTGGTGHPDSTPQLQWTATPGC
jgi:hypothetical protein